MFQFHALQLGSALLGDFTVIDFGLSVYIFYYILHLPLNINENVLVWQSAQRLIPFKKP